MQDPLSASNPMGVFASSFILASFAGLANLLRSGANVNLKSVLSATLNSGILGLSLALMWYLKFSDNIYFLVGLVCLAGLGGTTVIDFVIQLIFKKGGLNISFTKEQGAKIGDGSDAK